MNNDRSTTRIKTVLSKSIKSLSQSVSQPVSSFTSRARAVADVGGEDVGEEMRGDEREEGEDRGKELVAVPPCADAPHAHGTEGGRLQEELRVGDLPYAHEHRVAEYLGQRVAADGEPGDDEAVQRQQAGVAPHQVVP